MRRLGLLAALLLASSVSAQDDGKLVKETWDAIYLGGAKAGHVHTTVREVTRDGKPLLVSTLDTLLRLKRFDAVVAMGMTQKTDETRDGKVRALALTTKLDKGEVTQTARVEGDTLVVQVPGAPAPIRTPWQDDVIGLAKQESLWAGKKIEPGQEVSYKNYDPSIRAAVALTAKVEDREDVVVLEDKGTPDRPRGEPTKQSLWRVRVTAKPVTVDGKEIALPPQVLWVDDAGKTLRSESDIPGFGKMVMLRVSKGIALLNDGAPAEMPDLGLNTLVKLSKPVPKIHDGKKAVYRITVKGDPAPHKAFSADARQSAGPAKGDKFDLTVEAIREPQKLDFPAPIDTTYLRSSQMLDSASAKITEVANKVAAGEKSPLAKARKLEAWVHDNMKPTFAVGLVEASRICQDLKGDCRQHAMLLAALCRAAGVPARTAQGLVYVDDRKNGPILGFHMWTEVFVDGQWFGLDATLGKGSIGPGHLKIGDSAWKDGEGLAPLLTLVQVLGRLDIEVVSAE